MELQASRLDARIGAHGGVVSLAAQDGACRDHLLTDRGLAALARGEAPARAAGGGDSPNLLQAVLATCHARARPIEDTD